MATNWKAVTASDLSAVLVDELIAKVNGTTMNGQQAGDGPADPVTSRSAVQVDHAVAEIRAAVRNGGLIPLSVTAGTVPPEAWIHCLYLAAYRLVASTPNLASTVLLSVPGSPATPLQKGADEAKAWIDRVQKGTKCTEPDDPTGQDYLTALQPDATQPGYNPAIKSIYWGDLYATDDQYAEGLSTIQPHNMVAS